MDYRLKTALICFFIGIALLAWMVKANSGTVMGRSSIRAANGQLVRVGDVRATMIRNLGEPDHSRFHSGDKTLTEWVSYENLQYGLIFHLTIMNDKIVMIIAERK